MKVTFKKMMMLCLFIMTLFATNVANAQDIYYDPVIVELGGTVDVTIEIPDGYEYDGLDDSYDSSLVEVIEVYDGSRSLWTKILRFLGLKKGETTVKPKIKPADSENSGNVIYIYIPVTIKVKNSNLQI